MPTRTSRELGRWFDRDPLAGFWEEMAGLLSRFTQSSGHGLSHVVQQTCREIGLTYVAHKTVFIAVASHFRWLRRMGRPVMAITEVPRRGPEG